MKPCARILRRPGMAPVPRACIGSLGGLHWEAGDRERASACFTSGLECLGEDGNPLEKAQLFQEVGRLAFRAGDNANAIQWAEQALAAAGTEQDAAAKPEQALEAAATRAQA